MPAFIGIQVFSDGHPAVGPDVSAIIDVEVTATVVYRDIVVAVTGYSSQARVAIEAIAARGVGDETEKALISEIVDPG
jgi:hypothetical protein